MKLVWREPVLIDGIHSITDTTGKYQIHKSPPFGYTAHRRAKWVNVGVTKTAQEARDLCDLNNEGE